MSYRYLLSRASVVSIALVALALGSGATHAQQNAPAQVGSATLHSLQQTEVPSADAVDLALRLGGLKTAPVYPSSPIKVYKVGDTEQFWLTDEDTGQDVQFTARLVYATPHVFMWFQTGAKPDMKSVKASADRFENHIYPTVHRLFGSEDSPGVDGDVHLYIIHAHHLGGSIAGYYSSSSEYPRAVSPHSNQAQVFFINLDNRGAHVGSSDYEGTLAHEFQHMVHSHIDANEETWVNEGLSELSRLVNGYADTGFAPSFMADPTLQLDTWSEDTSANLPHYGAAYLFTTYFMQRFGQDAVRTLVSEPENGMEGIAAALRTINATDAATGKPVGALDLYADWQMANLLNDKRVADGRFAYTEFNETLPKALVDATLTPGEAQATVNQFGTQYLALTKPGAYTFSFSGPDTVRVVPANAHSGRSMWWSNRADKSDTRLTHAFDLTGVSRATLDYWLWYDIEDSYDYGYVQVSTDGGKTWQALATPATTTSDPHGAAYGPGYTGTSGATAEGDRPGWIEQKVDLSPYAGKPVMVRFEMVTDDGVSLPGMLVDDIRIPEIKYSTDAESDDGGWQAEGWLRMDNTLPQRFLIQAVQFTTTGTTITRLLEPMGGTQGEWPLKIDGDVRRIVISISGVTEFTTEASPIHYSLTAKE